MANIETRLGILARRIQGVIAIATRPEPPITRLEAYDQIVEEMELAGFGAPVHGGDLSADELAELRRQAAN